MACRPGSKSWARGREGSLWLILLCAFPKRCCFGPWGFGVQFPELNVTHITSHIRHPPAQTDREDRTHKKISWPGPPKTQLQSLRQRGARLRVEIPLETLQTWPPSDAGPRRRLSEGRAVFAGASDAPLIRVPAGLSVRFRTGSCWIRRTAQSSRVNSTQVLKDKFGGRQGTSEKMSEQGARAL